MGFFLHRDNRESLKHPAKADSFEVLDSDGVIRRYPRDAFEMIIESCAADEAQREVAHGWVILDQREVVESDAQGSSAADLIVGIEGLHIGGALAHQKATTVTRYTIGYLKDGARGQAI